MLLFRSIFLTIIVDNDPMFMDGQDYAIIKLNYVEN